MAEPETEKPVTTLAASPRTWSLQPAWSDRSSAVNAVRLLAALLFLCVLAWIPGEIGHGGHGGHHGHGVPRVLRTDAGTARPRLPEAIRSRRLIVPRLTGGFAYAPHRPDAAREPIDPATLRAWAAELAPRGADDDAGPLAAQAVLLLAGGPSERNLERAVARLESARAHVPESATIASDLAAVHLGLALQRPQPLALLRSLSLADEALALDRDLAEAVFNRALCLEKLGLWWEARWAWGRYLQLDDSSGWAEEASRHLAAISTSTTWKDVVAEVDAAARSGREGRLRELVDAFRFSARRHVEEKLLPAWAEAELAGNRQAAAEALASAKRVASVYAELTKDSLYVETVAAIEGAQTAGDRRSLVDLATAHRDFRVGNLRIGKSDAREARKIMLRVRTACERAGSPFAQRAALKIAICEHRLEHYQEALRELRAITARASRDSYFNLVIEALWMQGLVAHDSGQLAVAEEAYGRGVALSRAKKDLESEVPLQGLLAERLGVTGEMELAWRHLGAALALTPRLSRPERLYQVYAVAAYLAWRMEYLDIGLYYQAEALRWAMETGDPLAQAESHRWNARFFSRLGREEQARGALARARKALQEVPQDPSRRRVEAEIEVVEGELAAATDPQSAIASLTRAIESHERSDYKATLAPLYFARARSYVAVGDDASARDSFLQGLAAYESMGGQLDLESQRVSFFHSAEEALDDLVALELRQGREDAAFDHSDWRRARWLRDRGERPAGGMGTAGEPSQVARELRGGLPADRVLVQYALLQGRLSAWVVRRGGMERVELGAEGPGLERAVDRFRHDLGRGAAERSLRRDAGELYRRLVLPLERLLPPGAALIVVPDGMLWSVPFAALLDARNERYLVEQRAVGYAPSANLYLRALDRDRSLPAGTPPSALTVGNPAFDRGRYGELDDLPGAEDEARRVAALYPDNRLLLAAEATKSAFLAGARGREVIHFGGHAVANPENPAYSRLVLAAEAGEPDGGELSAREIGRGDFARTRLVVLGACSTAGGPLLRREGTASLARPFLAAGVPAVVASLWDVYDRPTSDLLVSFHREFAATGDALRALQKAQVQLLARGEEDLRSPAAWAAFQLIGEATFDRAMDGR